MKIKVEGQDYDFPEMDSLTWDESIILERYAGRGLETFGPGESLTMGAMKAFVVIALMRAHPEQPEKAIAATIGKIKLGELQDVLDAEGDARPPAESVSSEPSHSSGTSGDDSPNGSDPPDVAPQPDSGTPASPTGHTSDQETWVA